MTAHKHVLKGVRTAYHEAGHVVVGVGLGETIRKVDIVPVPAKDILSMSRSGLTQIAPGRFDIWTLPFLLAGDAAVRAMGSRRPCVSDDILCDIVCDLCDHEQPPDRERAMSVLWNHFYHLRLVGGVPCNVPFDRRGDVAFGDMLMAAEFLIARYREADRFTSKLVRRADVWASIKAVAGALLASGRGRLDGEEATALVSESVRCGLWSAVGDGLLGKWVSLDVPQISTGYVPNVASSAAAG